MQSCALRVLRVITSPALLSSVPAMLRQPSMTPVSAKCFASLVWLVWLAIEAGGLSAGAGEVAVKGSARARKCSGSDVDARRAAYHREFFRQVRECVEREDADLRTESRVCARRRLASFRARARWTL